MKTVSIIGLEKWESKYWDSDYYNIKHNEYSPNNFCIGVDDYTSPRHKFSDKYKLYKEQDLFCGKVAELKDSDKLHDVWVKPRQNFIGLGYNSKYYKVLKGFELSKADDYIYVENFEGRHVSIDYMLKDGNIIWESAFEADVDDDFTFKKWALTNDYLSPINFLKQNFVNYNGHVNIEMIGDKILEIHTRPSCQYLDLYNVNYPTLLISTIFENNPIIEKRNLNEPRISWVYWFTEKVEITNVTLIDSLGSLQPCYKEASHIDYKNMPNEYYRVACVNTIGETERPTIEVEMPDNKTVTVDDYLTTI